MKPYRLLSFLLWGALITLGCGLAETAPLSLGRTPSATATPPGEEAHQVYLPLAQRDGAPTPVPPTPTPGEPSGPGNLLYPTDFVYLGAFRLPDETVGGASWSYGGMGMTYYPGGDPEGEDDFPGSLFSTGSYPAHNLVSEFSIPQPVISAEKDLADLPVARTLQPFADITGGRQIPGLEDSLNVVDVQYLPRQAGQSRDKLYWVMYDYYLPQDELGHGWSELDLSAPQAQGSWRLGDFSTAATNKYLFEIPQAWADAHTPGHSLAAGRNRVPIDGSWGPALFAFGPWNDGNPPDDGSAVQATQLLGYPFAANGYAPDLMARDYSHSDEWLDGAWLTVGESGAERSAVILAGIKSLRREYALAYYGEANVDGCGYKGWHGEPYYAAILFYDPAMLAAVVDGAIAANEVQPYAMLNVEDRMFQQGCRRSALGGVGYDRARGLLYVMEREVAGDGDKPIVHVFRLAEEAQPADTIPPSPPANLRVEAATASSVDLAWDGATDDAHLVGYVIYRFGEPIATTTQTHYRDDKVNPSSTYTYAVAAWDASNNLGEAASLIAATPSGDDTRPPILYAITYWDLSDTGITLRWGSDEPATTVVTYELAYSGDLRVYRDEGLTRQHEAILTGLTPESGYMVWRVGGADAAGHANAFSLENWAFTTSPRGEGVNFAPMLNGIGSRRAAVGQAIVFTLEALDRDADDTLTFSAQHLPADATLDPHTGRFTWTPTTPGRYPITFQVSDGTQTDQERVTFFVE